MAVMECRRRRGYKPEIKQVVALATIFGIALVEVVIFFDHFPLFLELLLVLVLSTNVFPSPHFCI